MINADTRLSMYAGLFANARYTINTSSLQDSAASTLLDEVPRTYRRDFSSRSVGRVPFQVSVFNYCWCGGIEAADFIIIVARTGEGNGRRLFFIYVGGILPTINRVLKPARTDSVERASPMLLRFYSHCSQPNFSAPFLQPQQFL